MKKLFMTYADNGRQLSEGYREKYKESLIFDTSRHSIYAQNMEFGYIGNTTQEVTTSYDGTSSVILTVDEGNIALHNYNSVRPLRLNYTCDCLEFENNSYIGEIGAEITLNKFTCLFEGSTYVNQIQISYNNGTENSLFVTNLIEEQPYTDIELTVDYPITSNSLDTTYTFSMYGIDTHMWQLGTKPIQLESNVTIKWKYRYFWGTVSANNYNSFSLNNLNKILKTSGTTATDITTSLNYTINSFLCDNDNWNSSIDNPININSNGTKLYWFACPKSQLDKSEITGIISETNASITFKQYTGAGTNNKYNNIEYVLYVSTVPPIGNNIYISNNSTCQTINILYNDLLTLKNSNGLVPGQQYIITDYVTTTAEVNTCSAGHQFDLIVIADSVNKINCKARAVLHDGDTYFSNCELNKWEIWYDINNDTTKYSWADATNGKGVIYRMIGEYGNDVPYDFKNIQYKVNSKFVYTFGGETDNSLNGNSYSNIIGQYIIDKVQTLNWNIFGIECYCNIFGICCYNIFLGNNCTKNTFGNLCSNITIGNNCYANTFNNLCKNINFIGNSEGTEFKSYVNNIIIEQNISYINLFVSITIGSGTKLNTTICQGISGTSSQIKTIELNDAIYNNGITKNIQFKPANSMVYEV